MHTQRTIGLILLSLVAGAVAAWLALAELLNWPTATAIVTVVAAIGWALLRFALRPWYRTWGASTGERTAELPGDGLIDAAVQTTRAIAIEASASAVWPWLVQLGWGRAGWYSYDRIDNDGQPSATSIHPDWQHMSAGDVIAMTPSLGFTVRHVEPGMSIVSQSPDGTTWCLHLTPDGAGCRLVSRFRVPHHRRSFAAAAWSLIADPGSFVMERRMLLGIKQRAEDARRPNAAQEVTT
jgi:hypothetical protein